MNLTELNGTKRFIELILGNISTKEDDMDELTTADVEDINDLVNPEPEGGRSLDDWMYTVDDDSMYIQLWRYIGSSTNIVIPNDFGGDYSGYQVHAGTAWLDIYGSTGDINYLNYLRGNYSGFSATKGTIEDGVYIECGYNSSNYIGGSNIFYGQSSLRKVAIGHIQGTSINWTHLFNNCTSLTRITGFSNLFPEAAVTSIDSMFYGCSSITSLDFSGCDLTCVNSLKQTFYNCTNLESVNLCTGITNDDGCMNTPIYSLNSANTSNFNYAFKGDTSLKVVDLQGWYTPAGMSLTNMFYGCTSLQEVKVTTGLWNATPSDTTFEGCPISDFTYYD